jgi:hypothetical protein
MIDLFSYQFIAQAIGVIASGFLIFAFTHKSDNYLKTYLILGNFIFASHFLMLGAYAGMLIACINCFRVALSIKFHKSNAMMFSFMVVYILAGVSIYEKPWDLLPVFSSLLGTFSMYKLSGIKLRLCGMLGSFSWLTYGIIFHSIGGIIAETSAMILNISTIFRLRGDHKKDNLNDQNT